MHDPTADPREPTPATEWFESRGDFQAAFRRALGHVADHGGRQIILCDRDYADWPLGEMAVIETLTRWAMSHRKLVVLAAQFDTVRRQHPRWVSWRRAWSHIVSCRQVAEDDRATIPGLMIAPGQCTLRVLDAVHFRGRLSFERSDEVRDLDVLDAFLQRSEESFPVTQLGL